jgi:hypothetical protein
MTDETTAARSAPNHNATSENPILAELRETGARAQMVKPLESLRSAAQQAKNMFAGLNVMHPENMHLTQSLQRLGSDLYALTDNCLRSIGEQATHAARVTASQIDPKKQFAAVAEKCAKFMGEYGNYVVVQGEVEMVSIANSLRNAVGYFQQSYEQYLSITNKSHPQIRGGKEGDVLCRR